LRYPSFHADNMCKLLNIPQVAEKGEFVAMMDKLAFGEVLVEGGHKISEASHLFSRIEDDLVDTQKAKLQKAAPVVAAATTGAAATSNPVKDNIVFDDFTKIDFRTAKIVEAEKVKKSDKLLKLKLDLGFEQRTVVSGIAEQYTPEEIIGREVTLVANLAPRKIRGVESQGMVLMAENAEGKLSFVAPDKGWETGNVVR